MQVQYLIVILVCFHTFYVIDGVDSAARCKRDLKVSAACILTPQATEGPYYWNATIRQNITEGKPGIPFRLSVAVVDANNCSALPNVLVDLWHCDAIGIYSHYIAASQGTSGAANDNQTFFRGLALTDSNGIATFDTIYPGWYSGRATHIHIKVHVGMNITSGTYSGGHVSHTGQLFFNDSLTDYVATISPYSNHTITRTLNSQDGIYASANGSVTLVPISQNSLANYTGTITLGVNSSYAAAAVDGGSGGGGGGEPPSGGTPPSSSVSSVITTIPTETIPVSHGPYLVSTLLMNIIFLFFSFFI